METQIDLLSYSNFLSDGTAAEVQKRILANVPTWDLIKIPTTNMLFQALITEILFERVDEQALTFQTQQLELWFMQLTKKELSLDQLFAPQELERWITRLKNALNQQETSLIHKIHCMKLLLCLHGESPATISDKLSTLGAQILKLPALRGVDEDSFDKPLEWVHEGQKAVFLKAISPQLIATETTVVSCDKIKTHTKHSKYKLEDAYTNLVALAPTFTEEEFIIVASLCLDYANTYDGYEENVAATALIDILKQKPTLPQALQNLLLESLENKTHETKDFKIEALALFANAEHPQLLNKFNELVLSLIKHNNQRVRVKAYEWVKFATLTEALIEAWVQAISNKSDTYGKAIEEPLKAIAKQLSTSKLTNYVEKYVTLLNSEDKAEQTKACRVLAVLAPCLSPCPDNLILSLISLAKTSYEAIKALKAIGPNLLLLQKGFIEEQLAEQYNDCFAFKCIIELAPLLSSDDITESLMKNLIKAETSSYSDGKNPYELKRKAIAALSIRLSESQLNRYVTLCLENKDWNTWPVSAPLSPIPVSLLNGKLEAVIKKCEDFLNSDYWLDRERASSSLPYFENVLTLFPKGFLLKLVNMLQDPDYRVRDKVCQSLPKIMHLVEDEYVSSTFEVLLNNATLQDKGGLDGIGIERNRKASCRCLSLLAPRLNQEQITRAKEALILALDFDDWSTKHQAAESLANIAYRFSGVELTELLNTLIQKLDQYTFKHIKPIAHLMTQDAQPALLAVLFKAMSSKSYDKRAEACLTLSGLAPFCSKESIKQIINNFKLILNNKGTDLAAQIINNAIHGSAIENNKDRAAALNGLIRVARMMTSEDFDTILKLPETNFDIIIAKYLLERLRDLELKTQPKLYVSPLSLFNTSPLQEKECGEQLTKNHEL